MEALTGKACRKRKNSRSANEDFSPSKKKFASPSKEIIPSVFKKSLMTKRKVSSEQIVEPQALEDFKNIPCDTEAALLNLRSTFPVEMFQGRLPPVLFYSQLSSLVHSKAVIDFQLKKLAASNKILTFSHFSSSNYLIVFYSDFVALKRDGLFQRFVTEVLGENDQADRDSTGDEGKSKDLGYRSAENSKVICKEMLLKKWKFEEDEIRQLVNSGYLGVQEGGYYCISLPGAGEFMGMYNKGKKAIMNSIKRAKFGEILQTELEKRPMKKVAPLGVSYHIYDLIGSGAVIKLDTTSGPLLRIKRNQPS